MGCYEQPAITAITPVMATPITLSAYTARDYRPIFGLADTTKSSNWMRLKETLAVILALLLFSPLMFSGRK